MDGQDLAETDDYSVTSAALDSTSGPSQNGFKWKIEFTPKDGKDLSSLKGKKITIDFTAKLGNGAAIGDAGNKNTLIVKYSNNPNSIDGSEEGTIPEIVVITFTYKLVVNKVDEEQKPLANAGFTLYKIPANTAIPTGDNAKDAASKNAYYATKQIQTWTTTATTPTNGTAANQFSFTGIDDGTYVLCETTTPDGYNTMDPEVFTVSAIHGGNDGLTLTDLTGTKTTGVITFEKNVSAGSLTATISNKKGSTLPSTGGMGTTVFYVIGGVLVTGAAVMLIAKNKMSKN